METYTFLPVIKNHLKNDPILNYINAVEIRKYRTGSIPLEEHQNYAVVISPGSRKEKLLTAQMIEKTFAIDVICIVRNYDPEKSLIGVNTGEIGVLKMIEDTIQSLKALGELLHGSEVTTYLDELTAAIDFKAVEGERDAFFHEFTIPYTVKFKPVNIKG